MSATKTKLLIATLLALLLMVIAVACWVVVVLGPGRHQAGALTFDTLRENDIPGRYKWTEGPREFFIVLYDDHTFMNKDGTIFPTYRWEVTPTGLAITWQRNTTVFTHIEAVGFYTFDNGNRPSVRLEKLPPYAPAQLVSPAPVALLRLGALCETNGLTPVNNGDGEGDILPGNVDGGDGYRLVRKSTQADAFLYLQIAPELKDPPFTNALVIVEYFDRASASGRFGRLVIQYDDESGAYANSQPLHMTGSQAWEEATFYVATPLFQNRQNAGSDFRLAASRSELPVRSIKLFKNVNLPETKMPVRTWRRAN
jgi:hypothetical protein